MHRIEFMKKVEKLGYDVDTNSFATYVTRPTGSYVSASVENATQYSMKTGIAEDIGEELFNLCVEYSKTPINEREYPIRKGEEYLLRLEETDFYETDVYLKHNIKLDKYFLGDDIEDALNKVRFTQDEIDYIKLRFDTDLKEFEQIRIS